MREWIIVCIVATALAAFAIWLLARFMPWIKKKEASNGDIVEVENIGRR